MELGPNKWSGSPALSCKWPLSPVWGSTPAAVSQNFSLVPRSQGLGPGPWALELY